MCRASGPHLPRAGKITTKVTKGTKEQGEAEFFSRQRQVLKAFFLRGICEERGDLRKQE